jgi:hypothetical protein
MNTVVVGAIDGYSWEQVEIWWKSLKITGFSGDIHMLVYDHDEALINNLYVRNINVHLCQKEHGQVVIDRFKYYAKLAEIMQPGTWMICTDVNDIAFQYDPNMYLAGVPNDKNIVVASEGILFSGNTWARLNLENSFPYYYKVMIRQRLYNAGSIAVQAGIMHTLGREVFQLCMTMPAARNHDQAALNIMLQSNLYKSMTVFNYANDLWCFCGASSIFAKTEDAQNYFEELPVIKDGLCYVNDKLTCMFHHYTRNPTIKEQVRQRVLEQYRPLPI